MLLLLSIVVISWSNLNIVLCEYYIYFSNNVWILVNVWMDDGLNDNEFYKLFE